jgi:hypothetical protein
MSDRGKSYRIVTDEVDADMRGEPYAETRFSITDAIGRNQFPFLKRLPSNDIRRRQGLRPAVAGPSLVGAGWPFWLPTSLCWNGAWRHSRRRQRREVGRLRAGVEEGKWLGSRLGAPSLPLMNGPETGLPHPWFPMSTFTQIHVAISLVGIISGFVVVYALVNAQRLKGWTALFLLATAATSVTGFFFPFHHLLPSHKVGILSLVVLAVTIYALYDRHLIGAWRWIYAVGAVLALYLNVFVLIVQLFLKVPALKAAAPTQAEPPFLIAQSVALAAFIAVGILGVRRFRPGAQAVA